MLLAPAPPVCAAALSHARAQCTRHAPLLAPPSNCAHPTRIAGGCYVRVPPAVPPDGSYHRQLLPERARRVQPLLLVLRGQAQVRRLCAGQQHHVLPYARQPVQPVLHHLKGWPRFDLLSHRSTQADTPHTVASAKAAVRRRSPLAGTRIVRASSSASSPPHLAPPKAVNTRPLLLRCFEGANGGRPPPPTIAYYASYFGASWSCTHGTLSDVGFGGAHPHYWRRTSWLRLTSKSQIPYLLSRASPRPSLTTSVTRQAALIGGPLHTPPCPLGCMGTACAHLTRLWGAPCIGVVLSSRHCTYTGALAAAGDSCKKCPVS